MILLSNGRGARQQVVCHANVCIKASFLHISAHIQYFNLFFSSTICFRDFSMLVHIILQHFTHCSVSIPYCENIIICLAVSPWVIIKVISSFPCYRQYCDEYTWAVFLVHIGVLS